MKRRYWLFVTASLFVAGLLITVVLAGPLDGFDLGWHAIPGGGGRASSADYTVDSNVGQPAVG
jgi:hypothetical protein